MSLFQCVTCSRPVNKGWTCLSCVDCIVCRGCAKTGQVKKNGHSEDHRIRLFEHKEYRVRKAVHACRECLIIKSGLLKTDDDGTLCRNCFHYLYSLKEAEMTQKELVARWNSRQKRRKSEQKRLQKSDPSFLRSSSSSSPSRPKSSSAVSSSSSSSSAWKSDSDLLHAPHEADHVAIAVTVSSASSPPKNASSSFVPICETA